MEPKVSVMMPARNTEKYIGEAIESIIKQTYLNWELIIVDDKSTDSTRTIAQSYCNADSRIRIIDGDGICAANARNKAIDAATGEYIVNMDSDDVSMPNRIQLLMEAAVKHRNVVVGSNVTYVNKKMIPTKQTHFPLNNQKIRKGFQRIINRMTLMPGTILTETKLLRTYKYNEYCRILEDWDLILRLSENNQVVFQNLSGSLYWYRLNKGSISLSFTPRIQYTILVRFNEIRRKNKEKEIVSIQEMKNKINKRFVYRLLYVAVFFLKTFQHLLFLIRTKIVIGI